MDHNDVAAGRDIGTGPQSTLFLAIPYSSDSDSTLLGSGPGSPQSVNTPGSPHSTNSRTRRAAITTTLTKPTVDPWSIPLVPVDRWVPDAQVMQCMSSECRNAFTIFTRKHHCRTCGKVFCSACCSHSILVSAQTVRSQQQQRRRLAADTRQQGGGGGGKEPWGRIPTSTSSQESPRTAYEQEEDEFPIDPASLMGSFALREDAIATPGVLQREQSRMYSTTTMELPPPQRKVDPTVAAAAAAATGAPKPASSASSPSPTSSKVDPLLTGGSALPMSPTVSIMRYGAQTTTPGDEEDGDADARNITNKELADAIASTRTPARLPAGARPPAISTHVDPARTGLPQNFQAQHHRFYSQQGNSITNNNNNNSALTGDFGRDSFQGSSPLATATVRVCAACFYECQLAVARRNSNGELRKKQRGEFKMLQRIPLVGMLSFLQVRDLLEVSRVSTDFYYLAHDNTIWLQYNMVRWAEENEHLNSNTAANFLNSPKMKKRYGAYPASNGRNGYSMAGGQNAESMSLGRTGGKGPISLHASYNYTQFLDFARRQELARCQGLSSFSSAARSLLLDPIKICLIGPPSIGKTYMIHRFLGASAVGATMNPSGGGGHGGFSRMFGGASGAHSNSYAMPAGDGGNGSMYGGPENMSSFVSGSSVAAGPTTGFVRYRKQVRIAGGIHTEARLEIYDVCGDERYEELRRWIASQCHAVGLCYNAHRKVTMVEAAVVMAGVESALGPQPVVVCGLVTDPKQAREVSEVEAEGITARGHGSLQCSVSTGCDLFFQKLLQALLDRLVLGTATASTAGVSGFSGAQASDSIGSPTVKTTTMGSPMTPASPGTVGARTIAANRTVAQALLRLSMEESAIDVLLEPK